MKERTPNTVIFKRKKYSCIDMMGGDLFSRKQIGVYQEIYFGDYAPRIYAAYIFRKETLFLKELTYRETADGPLKTMKIDDYDFDSDKIDFTGKIRLARNVIKGLNIYADREYPLAFKTVIDMTLKRGCIVKINDRSQELAQRRRALNKYDVSESLASSINSSLGSLEW